MHGAEGEVGAAGEGHVAHRAGGGVRGRGDVLLPLDRAVAGAMPCRARARPHRGAADDGAPSVTAVGPMKPPVEKLAPGSVRPGSVAWASQTAHRSPGRRRSSGRCCRADEVRPARAEHVRAAGEVEVVVVGLVGLVPPHERVVVQVHRHEGVANGSTLGRAVAVAGAEEDQPPAPRPPTAATTSSAQPDGSRPASGSKVQASPRRWRRRGPPRRPGWWGCARRSRRARQPAVRPRGQERRRLDLGGSSSGPSGFSSWRQRSSPVVKAEGVERLLPRSRRCAPSTSATAPRRSGRRRPPVRRGVEGPPHRAVVAVAGA